MRRLALVVFALATALAPLPADLVERHYSRLVYPPVQRTLTSFSNATPIALLDLLLILAVVILLWLMLRRGRVLNVLAFAAVVWLLFLFTWGLNYRRVPLEESLKLDSERLTPAAVAGVARVAVGELNRLRKEAQATGAPPFEALAASLAPAAEETANDLGIPPPLAARPKQTLLVPYFRRAAVDGMTDPFFLETLVTDNLLDVEQPAVLAHEWGHLAGFADEAEASFVGWLTCMRADPRGQYSGWLALYGPLMNALPEPVRQGVQAGLAAGPREDLRRIAERLAEADPQVRAMAIATYDKFLRANRVAEGVASYDLVVRLVVGTQMGVSSMPAPPAPVVRRKR